MSVADQTDSTAPVRVARLLSVGLALAVLSASAPTYGQETAVDTPEVDAAGNEAEEEATTLTTTLDGGYVVAGTSEFPNYRGDK